MVQWFSCEGWFGGSAMIYAPIQSHLILYTSHFSLNKRELLNGPFPIGPFNLNRASGYINGPQLSRNPIYGKCNKEQCLML